MILVYKAPAGFIGQLHSNDLLEYWKNGQQPVRFVTPNYVYDSSMNYLRVSGKWCPTFDEAVASCMKELAKRVKHKQKTIPEKIAELQKELAELEADHSIAKLEVG